MKQTIRHLVPIGLFLLGLSCNSSQESVQPDKKITVRTVVVQEREVAVPIITSGKIAAKSEIKLSFKVGGIVRELPADEGQMVNRGDLLAALDLSEIQAGVAQARSGFEKATRDFNRVKNLFADSVATLEQMQDVTTSLDVARSNLEMAEFNLKHSSIKAPARGRILKRLIEENEMTGPGMPALIFSATGDAWIVRVGVSDQDVIRLQLGDSATVNFDAYSGIQFPATVSEIAEAADPMSGTFEVEIQLVPCSRKLVSGFVAKVKIKPSRTEKLAVIPIDALVEGNEKQAFVYKLNPSGETVQKTPVQLALIFENEVGIRTGLEQNNQIVTDGAPYLSDGHAVTVLK